MPKKVSLMKMETVEVRRIVTDPIVRLRSIRKNLQAITRELEELILLLAIFSEDDPDDDGEPEPDDEGGDIAAENSISVEQPSLTKRDFDPIRYE